MVRRLIIAEDQDGRNINDCASGYWFGGEDAAAWEDKATQRQAEMIRNPKKKGKGESHGSDLLLCWGLGRGLES